MKQTALTKLENWIDKFTQQNGAPKLSEILAQVDMLKDVEKEDLKDSFDNGAEAVDYHELHGYSRSKTSDEFFNTTFK